MLRTRKKPLTFPLFWKTPSQKFLEPLLRKTNTSPSQLKGEQVEIQIEEQEWVETEVEIEEGQA